MLVRQRSNVCSFSELIQGPPAKASVYRELLIIVSVLWGGALSAHCQHCQHTGILILLPGPCHPYYPCLCGPYHECSSRHQTNERLPPKKSLQKNLQRLLQRSSNFYLNVS